MQLDRRVALARLAQVLRQGLQTLSVLWIHLALWTVGLRGQRRKAAPAFDVSPGKVQEPFVLTEALPSSGILGDVLNGEKGRSGCSTHRPQLGSASDVETLAHNRSARSRCRP